MITLAQFLAAGCISMSVTILAMILNGDVKYNAESSSITNKK